MGTAATASNRPPRHDGEASRARLLHSGLRLFAQQGYAKTSTRELAEAAGVNIASISYYFGDKAGLYRAVFREPMHLPEHDLARHAGGALGLAEALQELYAGFVEPLKQGDTARLCMKLHAREMLEPTGLWQEEIEQGIQPSNDVLLDALRRHFRLSRVDDELRRLALCICGLGVHLHVAHDVINHLAPKLNASPQAIERWTERLVMYALAMVDAETRRRSAAGSKRKSA